MKNDYFFFLSNKEHFFTPSTSLVVEHTAFAALWNAIMLIHAWLLVSLLVQVQSDVCLPDSHTDVSFIYAKWAHQKFQDDKLCFITWIFKHHENQRGRKLSVFFSFTHSGWSVERVIFHLPWSSLKGFNWFQQELDETAFVMSDSWADVTSKELAVFPPSAQCVCLRKREFSAAFS